MLSRRRFVELRRAVALGALVFATACLPEAPPEPPTAQTIFDRQPGGAARAGRLAASVSVGPMGQATVSLELPVLDAGNGFEPTLGLAYYSGADRGDALGRGWSLAGQSTIRRCPAAPPVDDYRHAVDLSDRDRLCLDGKKLIAVAGTYLGNGSEYRVQREDFTRIRFTRAAGAAGTFTVWYKNGEIATFGGSDESRLLHSSGAAAAWHLDTLRDRRGNEVRYRYTTGDLGGEPTLSSVEYGGNATSNQPHRRRVVFDYARIESPSSWFLRGDRFERQLRLSEVSMYADDALGSRVRLGYEPVPHSNEPVLAWAQQCFADDSCFPATTFDYSESAPGLNAEAVIAATYRERNPTLERGSVHRVLDMDGDGRDDLVTVHRESIVVERATATGYAAPVKSATGLPTNWNPRKEALFVYDIDGDQRIDVLTTVSDPRARPTIPATIGLFALFGTDTGFEPAVRVSTEIGNGQDPAQMYLEMADADADGSPDLFAYTTTGVKLLLSRGRSFETAGENGYVSRSFGRLGAQRFDRHLRDVVDVDGDGAPDLVMFGETAVLVSLARDGSYLPPVAWTAEFTPGNSTRRFSGVDYLRLFDDMNGDGLPDIVGFHDDGVYVGLNTGVSFAPAERWLDDLGVRQGWSNRNSFRATADLDGDGMSDFVAVSNNGVRAILGRRQPLPPVAELPASALVERPAGAGLRRWSKDANAFMFADVNSNGQSDLVFILPDSVFSMANPGGRARLTSVNEGMGKNSRITYTTGCQDPVYRRTRELARPLLALPCIGPVVSRLEQSNGIGGMASIDYRYENAVLHTQGMGFLGYERWISTDNTANVQTRARYSLDYAQYLNGLPVQEERVRLGEGTPTVVRRTTTEWESRRMSGNDAHRYVYAEGSVVEELDASGRVLSTVDTRQTHDARGNPVNSVVTRTDGGDTQTVTTVQTYNADDTGAWLLGRVTSTDVTYQRPGQPRVVRKASFGYDDRGYLEWEAREQGTPFETRTDYVRSGPFLHKTSLIRSWHPNLGAGLDVSRIETSFAHDEQGYVSVTTNPLGHTVEITERDPIFGGVVRRIDENGLTSTADYDPAGRRITSVEPDGTTRRMTRALCGASCPPRAAYFTATSRGGSAPVVKYFDALDRVVRLETRRFGLGSVRVDTEYNAHGAVARESLPYAEGTAPADIAWTTYEYDNRLRLIAARDSAGRVERNVYTPRTVTSIDAKGRRSVRHVDAAGQVQRIVDAANGTTRYFYDAADRLVAVEAPDGSRMEVEYDQLGRRTALRDPSVGDREMAINALDLPARVVEAGRTTDRVYDGLGRMVEQTRRAADGTVRVDEWTYDATARGIGRLASMSGPESRRELTYDSFGRLETQTLEIDGARYVHTSSYDGNGRLASVTYPSGVAVSYDYDAEGTMVAVRSGDRSRTYWELLEVTPLGAVRRSRLGNGLVVQADEDPNLGIIESIRAIDGGGTLVHGISYEHDLVGNLESRNNLVTGLVESYEHDDLDRVTKATLGSRTIDVDYGAAGNIEWRSDRGAYEYGQACDGVVPGPHAATLVGSTALCYDSLGRVVRNGDRSLRYGVADVPVAIDSPDATVAFRYDGYDTLLARTSTGGGGSKRIVYGAPGYEEHTGPNGVERRHRVGQLLLVEKDGALTERYMLGDHLGSTSTVVDERGAVVEHAAYDPWGARIDPFDGTPTAEAPETTQYGFTAHEHLDSVGLIHMRGRVYDPSIGRFLSADPKIASGADSQAFNRYAYVGNRPLSTIDPDGRLGISLKKLGKKLTSLGRDIGKGLSNPGRALLGGVKRLGNWLSKPQNQRLVAGLAIAVASGYGASILWNAGTWHSFAAAAVSAAGGYTSGLVMSNGNHAYARRSALTALAFFAVGSAFDPQSLEFGEKLAKVAGHGVVGGVASVAEGGTFESGFAVAAFNQGLAVFGAYGRAAELLDVQPDNLAFTTASSALVGGATSELTGGTFENGAITGAFAAIFNDAVHHERKIRQSVRDFFDSLSFDFGIEGTVTVGPVLGEAGVSGPGGEAKLQTGIEADLGVVSASYKTDGVTETFEVLGGVGYGMKGTRVVAQGGAFYEQSVQGYDTKAGLKVQAGVEIAGQSQTVYATGAADPYAGLNVIIDYFDALASQITGGRSDWRGQ